MTAETAASVASVASFGRACRGEHCSGDLAIGEASQLFESDSQLVTHDLEHVRYELYNLADKRLHFGI